MNNKFCLYLITLIIIPYLGIPSPKLNAVKIIHLMNNITSVIIAAAYSAFLTSSLAVTHVSVPFSTTRELIDDNTYKIGVFKDLLDGASSAVRFFDFYKEKKQIVQT